MLFVLKTSAQIKFGGFDTTVCASPMTTTFSYNNYVIGSSPTTDCVGYSITVNGTEVENYCGVMGTGGNCENLVFINDSVGYSVILYFMGGFYLRKTSDHGVTWQTMAIMHEQYLGLYIINEHYAYMIGKNSTTIDVIKCSDLYPQSTLISDANFYFDIYKTDTILNNSLCNIDSLKLFWVNTGHEFTYHINFFTIPAGINTYSDAGNKFSISPNPTNGTFKINTNKEYKTVTIEITDVIGQTVFATKEKETSFINITLNQPPGLYFITIIADEKREVMKVVKE